MDKRKIILTVVSTVFVVLLIIITYSYKARNSKDNQEIQKSDHSLSFSSNISLTSNNLSNNTSTPLNDSTSYIDSSTLTSLDSSQESEQTQSNPVISDSNSSAIEETTIPDEPVNPTEVPNATEVPTPTLTKAPESIYFRPGDIVTFGVYEQDNNIQNDQEPIEWIVLKVEFQRSLLITKNVLDIIQYNKKLIDITWEKSGIRNYLNNTFYYYQFNQAQQDIILEVENKNPDNPFTGATGGKNTKDFVFLLNYDEARLFFDSDESRIALGTEYARAIGRMAHLYEFDLDEFVWFLRTPGGNGDLAAIVGRDGFIDILDGAHVNTKMCGMRPAIWVGTTIKKDLP